MKTTTLETLTFRKNLTKGRIEAVHAWATGFQVLEFTSKAAFDKTARALATGSKLLPDYSQKPIR